MLISTIDWACIACLNHDEMASFVSVMVGILFCTSYWEKPKEYVKHEATVRYKKFCYNILEERFNKGTKSRINTIEGIECFNDEVKLLLNELYVKLDSVYHNLYIPWSSFMAFLGVAVLLLGVSSRFGIGNLLLFLPILFYLSSCYYNYKSFTEKLTRLEEKPLERWKQILRCIDQRKAAASREVDEVKNDLTRKS